MPIITWLTDIPGEGVSSKKKKKKSVSQLWGGETASPSLVKPRYGANLYYFGFHMDKNIIVSNGIIVIALQYI